ncbi:MAG: hypothetical protein NTV33_10265 [Coprothermobacterota bacterium]|nr:hypothetical protein [Coprothermobacterota bacterium]
MDENEYERLAGALDRLPNGFPRTSIGVEIAILRKIFSTEEAWLAGLLTGQWEPLDVLARRVGLTTEEANE